MSQILDPLPNERDGSILCSYVNATSQIQIGRITNVANWYFERVVFPGQRLVFEALPSAILEIHCGMMASAILSDTIPCEKLSLQKIEQKQDVEPKQETAEIEQAKKVAINNSTPKSRRLNLAV